MSINTDTCFKTLCHKKSFNVRPTNKNGTILKIHHCISDQRNRLTSIRFLHATFNLTGDLFALSNHIGKIYVFDFKLHKYCLLAQVNCSIIKFITNCNVKTRELLLVGATVGSIHIINSNSGKLVSDLFGHKTPVTEVSFSDNEQCITLANNEAMIWDLKTYSKLQVLELEEKAILKFIMFIPASYDIIACFQDESIQIWKGKTYQPVNEIKSEHITGSSNKMIIRSIAFTSNGKQMAIVGHSSIIYLFDVETLMINKEYSFCDIHDVIKKAQYLPSLEEIFVFLTSRGVLFFYNMTTESLINKIELDTEVWKFALDPSVNKIATIDKSGEVNIYSLEIILAKINRSKDVRIVVKSTMSRNRNALKKATNNITNEKLSAILEVGKLQAILKEYKEYPNMYRKIIWSHILQLPNDIKQYEVIAKNLYESKFNDFEKMYPLEVKQDMKNLKKIMGNLICWCPFLSAVNYLPVMVFPFVKYLQSEPVVCFETLMAIIVNYCQYWFEYHPVPPLNVLGLVESLIIQQDTELIEHFNKNGVTSKTYAWMLLQTFFSEVLPSNEWLIFSDHILSNEPAFLIVAVAAYSLINRMPLLNLNHIDDFNFFFRTNTTFDFKRFIARSYKLLEDDTMDNHPRAYITPIITFKRGKYPIFDQFPKNCLEVCESINQLRTEANYLKREEEIVSTKSEQFDKIKELQRNADEYIRIAELNKLYCAKLTEERKNVCKRRERVYNMKTNLHSKEKGVFQDPLSGLIINEGNSNRAISQVQKKRNINSSDKVEEDLLKHYTNLLKHKIQIEGHIDDTVSLNCIQLKENHKKLIDGLNKTQTEIAAPRTEYLKQLNVMTGVAAINSLIQKVESKISKKDALANKSQTKHLVSKLASESEQLSEEINDLMVFLSEIN